ncbi:HNH endonuclease [Yersinia enterocolitica]|nr:HNH endonuclease [Yersinia enterocolitica]MBW5848701.1 HNH endonuclease [Yersinia enterocolitica]MBW5857440.1 HNH endonuclease [Yersinia enterocolitica]MBW5861375.1 HNH endonuclease [Yersinia enterocolitica]MBW5866114.1 HNH endonuclease [Yersinia enterocolitica]
MWRDGAVRPLVEAGTHRNDSGDSLNVAGIHVLQGVEDVNHVHHIRPLRTLGEGYCINPVTDLVPLCPNCHAMIHRGNEARPLPVDDLRKMLRN